MISYGMGEHSIIEIADALASGLPVEELTYMAGTVFKCRDLSSSLWSDYSSFLWGSKSKQEGLCRQLCHSVSEYRSIYSARPMAESYGTKGYIIQNPPALPLTQEEMDDVYALPYTGKFIPCMRKAGRNSGTGRNRSAWQATEDALAAVISVH